MKHLKTIRPVLLSMSAELLLGALNFCYIIQCTVSSYANQIHSISTILRVTVSVALSLQ